MSRALCYMAQATLPSRVRLMSFRTKMFVVSFVSRVINAELSVPSITYVLPNEQWNGKLCCIGYTYVCIKEKKEE